MRFTGYSFGSIRVDGVAYDHDLILDRGKIRKRKKAASRKFRGAYGHTPLSADEDIPWRCRRLVVGTGADGALQGAHAAVVVRQDAAIVQERQRDQRAAEQPAIEQNRWEHADDLPPRRAAK